MNFEEMKDQVKYCKSIDELFDLWRKAHVCEENYEETTVVEKLIKINKKKNESTEYPEIAKEAFIADGYISERDFKSSPKKILFILKEANVQAYRSEEALKNPSQDSQFGFYREYIEKDEDLNRPRQQEKMGRLAYYILYNVDTTNPDEIKSALKKTAFMNINKRGGNNAAKKIGKYTKKYIPYVKRQIELLNPDIIVVLGKSINERSFVPDDIPFIKFNHTADRHHGIYKTDAYVEKFISEYNAKFH